MRRALLWKDYRIFRDVFVGGLVLMAGSYGFAALILVMNGELAWDTLLAGGASLTRFTAILVAALFGGYAFAQEREERSDQFLAVLPIPRARQLTSKLCIAVAALSLYWLLSILIVLAAFGAMGVSASGMIQFLRAMTDFAMASAVAFGVAWWSSSFVRSPLTAAIVGLASLAPLCVGQLVYTEIGGVAPYYFFSLPVLGVMVLVAAVGIAMGVRRFLRGVDTLPCAKARRSVSGRTGSAVSGARAKPIVALLWKDFQLVRGSFWLGLGLILLPHSWSVIASLMGRGGISPWGCLLSIALCTLIFPFWAGQLMGGERVSRAMEYLQIIPIRFADTVASKCAMVCVVPLLLVLANGLLLIMSSNRSPEFAVFDSHLTWEHWHEAAAVVSGLGLCNGALVALAVAAFLAARGGRVILAVVVGVLASPVTLTVWASLSTVAGEGGNFSPLTFALCFSLVCSVVLAVLTMAGGCVSDSNRLA